eukprot:GABW01002084.1.p1 GENE.GABW01002084.1~~GABW01002084.1.p1  ORF type:complete len:86 (+),score=3.13 GABW01002084.1:119-376(+)
MLGWVVGETIVGGDEGESRFQWVRVRTQSGMSSGVPLPPAEVIESATGREYMPTTHDVGCRIRFVYTPVRTTAVQAPLCHTSQRA